MIEYIKVQYVCCSRDLIILNVLPPSFPVTPFSFANSICFGYSETWGCPYSFGVIFNYAFV